ncbi:serine/threonine kinase, partial [Scheffersomyces stipitis CBS 6054]
FKDINEILNFPIESSHAYSYAHLSPNSLALRLNVLKRSLEILKDRPDLFKWQFLSSEPPSIHSENHSGTNSPRIPSVHPLYTHGNLSTEIIDTIGNQKYKVQNNASSAALAAFFRPPLKRSDSLPITSESAEEIDDSLQLPKVTRVVSSSATFSHDSILRDDLKDIITLLENDLDSLVSKNSEIASTLHDLSLSNNDKGDGITTKDNHLRYEFVKNKLLYALATPFVENSAMTSSLLQSDGSSSTSSIPVRPSTTALNMLNNNYTTQPPPSSNSRPFHAMPAGKHTLPQSVFTVEVDTPWSVKAANDLACLMFGVSKNMIRALTLMDLIAPQFRDFVSDRLTKYMQEDLETSLKMKRNSGNMKQKNILFAGEIVAIARPGDQNYAWTSMWAKRKGNLIICMFDQIPCDAFDIVIAKNKEDVKNNGSYNIQSINEIAGKFIDSLDISKFTKLDDVSDTLAAELSDGDQSIIDDPMDEDDYESAQDVADSELINHTRYYTLQFKGEENIPCAITSNPLEIDSNRYEIKLKIHAMPYIAGIFVISSSNYTILSCNNAIAKNMFGKSSQELNHHSIDEIIPNFTKILTAGLADNSDSTRLLPGLVLPEHFFRKYEAMLESDNGHTSIAEELFFNSRGIKGLHRDGKTIHVDVQVRASSYDTLVLWVTYSRASTKRNISSELDRLNSSTSSLSLSSDGKSVISLTSLSDTKTRGNTNLPSQLKLLPITQDFLDFTPTKDEILRKNSTRQPKNGSFGIPVSRLNSSLEKAISIEKLNQNLEIFQNRRVISDGSNTLTTIPISQDSTETQATTASGIQSDISKFDNRSYHTYTEEEILLHEQRMLDEKMAKSTQWPKEVGSRRRTKKFSEFVVLKDMGEGAYGKVVLAQHKEDPIYNIIVKCIDKERILVDTWVRDRKLGTIPSEIQIMAYLNSEPHPNIMRIIDFFEDSKYYYLETPIFGDPPAIDLFDFIEVKKNMSELECQFIFKQIVSSIYHLHKHGIVHRDIKDENVIVDENGVIKLIDFGSAGYTRSGPFDVFVGTIDYASPEVLRGEKYEGKPQDIWALGILLYTMMYKENPFYNVDEIMEGDLRVPYVISEASLKLIEKILVREVNKRPTITDIVEDEWLQI